MVRYFKTNKQYFKFIHKNKDKIEIENVKILKNSLTIFKICVIYNLL